MNIFISADIEGIAGVVSPQQCRSGNGAYELARVLMEKEVNAAIEGAFDAGASNVIVADSHGDMTNLRAEFLDPRAQLVSSKPRPLSMLDGLEQGSFDGLFLIGFHSAAGEKGVLAHTINGSAFYRVTINGETMAEADIYSALAAEHGTPLWLVSGDNELQDWISAYYPGTNYACVKRCISTTSAQSMSPQCAQTKISDQAYRAVKNASQKIVSRISAPYTLTLESTKPVLTDLFTLVPGVKEVDARTVAYTGETMQEIVGLLSAFSYLSATQY